MMKRNLITWIIPAGAGTLLLLFLVLVYFGEKSLQKDFGPHNLGAAIQDRPTLLGVVGGRVRCKLPDSARDIHYWTDGGKDPSTWIAVTVDAADLPKLKAQLHSSVWKTTLPPLPRPLPKEFEGWWHPAATNIDVRWEGDAAGGDLWILDYTTGTIYYCFYSS